MTLVCPFDTFTFTQMTRNVPVHLHIVLVGYARPRLCFLYPIAKIFPVWPSGPWKMSPIEKLLDTFTIDCGVLVHPKNRKNRFLLINKTIFNIFCWNLQKVFFLSFYIHCCHQLNGKWLNGPEIMKNVTFCYKIH